ncbi:MAG TPA: hypothetical protein VN709_09895 [Terriglobales bacterium]|nr:hypothetical protein [Terriglobales bacterium]
MAFPADLNETQRRHLYDGCAHLDRQLDAIAAIVRAAESGGLFPRYQNDLTPEARAAIDDRTTRVRTRLQSCMEALAIAPEKPPLSASQAIASQFNLAEIGLDEIGPRAMRGYGEVSPAAADALDALVRELTAALATAADAAPRAPSRELGIDPDTVMEALAAALADAVADGRPNDELPLAAGDCLAALAQAELRSHGFTGPCPVFEIDAIRWRLDRPRLAALGRDHLLRAFRRQLAPLRAPILDALRRYFTAVRWPRT